GVATPAASTAVPLTAAPSSTPTDEPTPAPTLTEARTEEPHLRLSESADIVSIVPNVTLDVELFYAERWMRVHQTVTLKNTSPDTWDEVVFNDPINGV